MILVDTSVLIDYLRGRDTPETRAFSAAERAGEFGISPYTFCEILQGAANEVEFRRLRRYLLTQPMFWLPSGIEPFELAASTYAKLRRSGITIRSTIDVLIALTAIEHQVPLLHDDRDFDAMAAHLPDLRIVAVA